MEWKRPFMSTAEEVFDNWLRRTHSDAFAADYYRGHDPDRHDRRDPRHWPHRFTRNDQPLYRR
jgi:hypothetical protein